MSKNRKKILRDDEVSELVSALCQNLPDGALKYVESLGIDIEVHARFFLVAKACKQAREALCWTGFSWL